MHKALDVANFVRTYQQNSGLRIGDPREVAEKKQRATDLAGGIAKPRVD